jgi:CheY-like chemotaxis protein
LKKPELAMAFVILVVEDNETNREPDLILMDIRMPIMDGWTAVKKLKESPETQDIILKFAFIFKRHLKSAS